MCNMKKKIISCVLLASVSFYIGCYNNQTITSAELKTMSNEELKAKVKNLDLTVGTKDSAEYKFTRENFRIHGDTLSGFDVQSWKEHMTTAEYNELVEKHPTLTAISAHSSAHDTVVTSISLADITSVKTKEFSLGETIFVVLGVGAVGFLVSIYVLLTNNK